MFNKSRFAMSLVTIMALTMGIHAIAQETANKAPVAHVSGTIDDYVWVEVGTGAGAWHVTGQWSAEVEGSSGKGKLIASLLGVRSDLWVLQTFADPANPALRTPHTHHVGLSEADVSVIPNGIRLEGTAIITANGSAAPYSNSTVRVDLTGGSVLRYSNVKLTFFGAAVDHFGPQPYEGVVVIGR
jgi:hypothetical protein